MKHNLLKSFLVAMLAFGGLTLMGCETMRGVGKDTQKAGEKLEDAAERNR